MSGKAGLIDESGKFVINPQYANIQLDGDLCLIVMDGKHGWSDLKGKIVINPQFDEAFRFGKSNLAPAKLGENFGYVDKDGKVTINPQFEFAYPFSGSFALVKSGGKFGLINEEGSYIVNPQFEKVSRGLVSYLITGVAWFDAIETDFFDIEAIASVININSWEGLTLSSTAEEVAPKIIKSPYVSDTSIPYSPYSDGEYAVLRDKEIGKEATLSMSLVITPYTEVMNGWYPEKVYNPSAKPYALRYQLKLKSAKAINKKKDIADAILKRLEGWVKNDAWSTETELFYTKGSETIAVETNTSGIDVAIFSTDFITTMKEMETIGYSAD
jgi:hypothetical protein